MRKTFLLLIAVLALSGTLWFNVGASATNPLVKATVYSNYFTDTAAGVHVPAQLYNASGNLQELPCVGTETPGYVSCQFPAEYAGQQLPIQLTRNGIMYVELVDVPAQ